MVLAPTKGNAVAPVQLTLASGGGTPGLQINNPNNDFQGDVTINSGTYLRLRASEVIPNTADVTIAGYLRLEGADRVETIGGLHGGGNPG